MVEAARLERAKKPPFLENIRGLAVDDEGKETRSD